MLTVMQIITCLVADHVSISREPDRIPNSLSLKPNKPTTSCGKSIAVTLCTIER